jgi:phosphotriesterase-related protein
MQARYGGHGYHHLFVNVMPQFKRRGLTEQQEDMLTVQNPATWLAWEAANM